MGSPTDKPDRQACERERAATLALHAQAPVPSLRRQQEVPDLRRHWCLGRRHRRGRRVLFVRGLGALPGLPVN